MRKFMTLMVAFMLPLFAFEMRADENEQIKMIPLWKDDGPMLRRDIVVIPIESCFSFVQTGVYTTVVEDLGDVELHVTNTFTGEFWSCCFDSSIDRHLFLPISGAQGYYVIEYITEIGDVYVGDFLIE